MLFRRRKVILVLGGGGVRGLAHLGILKVLEQQKIPIDGIVGTSAGAIIGSLYAMRPSADAAERKVLEFLSSIAFRRLNLRFDLEPRGGKNGKKTLLDRLMHGLKRQVAMELLFRRPSIFKADPLTRLIGALIAPGKIEEAQIPLYITALDLVAGAEVILDRGDLHTAVVASSSVPGFFPPIAWNGRLLSDAGLVNNMPVGAAREVGAECVIAVSLNSQIDANASFPTGIEVIFRNEEIGTKLVNERRKRDADVVIEPDLGARYWLDFEHPEQVVAAGEAAARAVLPQIQAAVSRKKLDLPGFDHARHRG